MSVDELRSQLQSLQRSHDALLRSIATSDGSFGPIPDTGNHRPVLNREHRHSDAAPAVFADSSTLSDDSDEEDEDYFVQAILPSQSFDHEHLREHLRKYTWNEYGRAILSSIVTERGRLKEPNLFPSDRGAVEDRSHYSHFQVYDVGSDGRVEMIETSGKENAMSRVAEIWHSIKDIGAENSKVGKAVGRITIAREPSPILFAALHLTMNNVFDMDELFKHLVQTEATSAHMHRAFLQDRRHQRTFFFTFEYYTIIGEDCKPMQWQRADKENNKVPTDTHIPLTRCSAVVALALYDDNPRRIRNRSRRANTKYGWVQDIWSPWQVLNVQCYPDWRATTDTFETGWRYLNGPEAFLHALLTEYRDARKRYEEIYNRISRLITPPLDFVFDAEMRDQRLFEDEMFTWTRRYFYGSQTLANMNDSIKYMIDAFEDTFTEEVWEGKSATLWPLFDESPRNEYWKRRLRLLRLQFEREMKELYKLVRENNDRRKEIHSLQDQLFSGTSIQESRRSVELADTTVQQGRNIKLLTLVNLFFLPLTFVTSVYGMTNMDPEDRFWHFGLTLAAICIPFFSLIGFLSTDSGYRFWMEKARAIGRFFKQRSKPKGAEPADFEPIPPNRTRSTEEGMQMRLGREMGRDAGELRRRGGEDSRRSDTALSHPHIQRIVEAAGERKKSANTRVSLLPPPQTGAGEEMLEERASGANVVKNVGDDGVNDTNDA